MITEVTLKDQEKKQCQKLTREGFEKKQGKAKVEQNI